MSAPRNIITKLLDAVSTTATSDVYGNQGQRVFQVKITGTATVQMEASVNDVDWISLGDAITASGGFESEAPWPYMRARVSSYTSGEITVWVAD